jgi:hypothetical protein
MSGYSPQIRDYSFAALMLANAEHLRQISSAISRWQTGTEHGKGIRRNLEHG